MARSNNDVKLLLNRLRMWGWPFLFSRLDRTALLICDAEIQTELNAMSGGLKCQTVLPGDLDESLPKATKIVVVFMRNNELALAQKLRTRYPEKTVLSAAHDLAANAGAKKPALPKFSAPASDQQLAARAKPILLLATPGADSPYLASLLKNNKIADPVEYIDSPLVNLIEWLDCFSTAAFFKSLRKLYGNVPEPCVLMRTDVLLVLIEKAGLTKTSLLRYMRTTGFRVIGLRRNDRITQCAQAQLMRERKIRSIWDIPAGQREKFAEKTGIAIAASITSLNDIARGEKLIELIHGSGLPSSTFVLEELATDPEAALQMVCELLGQKSGNKLMATPYTPPSDDVPIVGRLAAKLKRELIDRTGIHSG